MGELELMPIIALENVMKHVEKESLIYGDFLKFYKINLGMLPVEKETELYKVGGLYHRIENIHSGLLDGYITLLMLRKGFIHEAITEEESEHEYEKAIKDLIDYMVNERDSDGMICVEDYVNVQNPNEKIRIQIVHAAIMPDVGVPIPSGRNIIEKMSNDFKNFLIVDPLLFRCGKEEINSLKEKLQEKTGENIVYHPDEFSEENLVLFFVVG